MKFNGRRADMHMRTVVLAHIYTKTHTHTCKMADTESTTHTK